MTRYTPASVASTRFASLRALWNPARLLFSYSSGSQARSRTESPACTTFTHPYHGGYGGPEIEQTTPVVKAVKIADDGLSATLVLDKIIRGHVYDFDLGGLRAGDKDELLHRKAYYTVNEVPVAK